MRKILTFTHWSAALVAVVIIIFVVLFSCAMDARGEEFTLETIPRWNVFSDDDNIPF